MPGNSKQLMEQKLRINHAAVWVAAVLAQMVPPLIYSEVFFGIRWAELNQLTETDFESFDMATGLALAFAGTVVTFYVMAWLFTKINVVSGPGGLKVALLVWLAFVFVEVGVQNHFSLRPVELTLIDEVVVLVKYEIAGVLLGVWRKYS